MKFLAALGLLATLVSCAGPPPGPVQQVAVFEPGVACRVDHSGSPVVAERGIGGTGTPGSRRVADRGIGGTGIVGVVTGFASVCVDGLEVRFDKTVPVSIDNAAATAGQLRVGQVVVINASDGAAAPASVAWARAISVRYEVSGLIEAVDTSSDTITVAGQLVIVRPATWVAGHFGVGGWVSVSGLRQSDGSIVASRLDRARPDILTLRGQITRQQDVTRIGALVLHEPALATVKAGTFVSVMGRYRKGAIEVTSVEADRLPADPAGYFGPSTDQIILQAFVHVGRGAVSLANGETFQAGPGVEGNGSGYRNAVIRLKRTAGGDFTATELHYTTYRSQPEEGSSRGRGHGTSDMVLPPDAPSAPPSEDPPGGGSSVVPLPSPEDAPASDGAPPQTEPSADGSMAHQMSGLSPGAIGTVRIAANK
jgi:hypothetical protein